MPVTLICPNLKCRTILQVPATVRGKKVRCGRCGRTFVVPSSPTRKGAAAADKEGTASVKK